MNTFGMSLEQYALFLIPLALSLGITPLVISYAKRIGAIDQPNERKVHKNPVPRLGGVAIYVSFFVTLAIALYLDSGAGTFAGMTPHTGLMLVISLTMVLLIGIWDDLYQLSPGKKLIGQVVAGTVVYFAGFKISAITHPFSPDLLSLGYLDYPATLLWVVGITNAINLIDGLDGLAGGVAVIVSLTMFAIASLKGDVTTAMMALMLAGSILGFLRYNFNGARIFLGDSGSLFIGFLLAILSIRSSTKGSTAFSIMVPMLALGLPIMDTLLSMTRRLLRSIVPQEKQSQTIFGRLVGMFLPDRGHIHHRLIDRGLSHRNVVLLLYMVSCAFGLGAFAVTITNNFGASLILVTVAIATFIGVSQLRYKEMAVLRNGTLLPMYEWPLMNSTLFHGFLDVAFIVAAFLLSLTLSDHPTHLDAVQRPFYVTLSLICGVQLLVFYLVGMYKSTFRQMGIGDLLKLLKTVTIAVFATFVLLEVVPNEFRPISLVLVALDFYFLLSFVVGARVSYLVLHYFSRNEQLRDGKRILVYGADAKGLMMVQQILQENARMFNPVGFLDDDPQLEGKKMNGYPIYGGHWKLARLLNTLKIDEIHIASEDVKPEALRRLMSISREKGVIVRSLKLQLEEVEQVHDTRILPLREQFAAAGK